MSNKKNTTILAEIYAVQDTFVNSEGKTITYTKAYLKINGLSFPLNLKQDYNLKHIINTELDNAE